MSNKRWSLTVGFPTFSTFIRIFCINPLMFNKIWTSAETFTTFIAFIRFLCVQIFYESHMLWIGLKTRVVWIIKWGFLSKMIFIWWHRVCLHIRVSVTFNQFMVSLLWGLVHWPLFWSCHLWKDYVQSFSCWVFLKLPSSKAESWRKIHVIPASKIHSVLTFSDTFG